MKPNFLIIKTVYGVLLLQRQRVLRERVLEGHYCQLYITLSNFNICFLFHVIYFMLGLELEFNCDVVVALAGETCLAQ